MKTVFIAWETYHARTELLARSLGARVFYTYRLGKASGPRLLLKYVWQSLDTLGVLLRERPDVVLVQTPPVFSALAAALSTLVLRRTRLIIDAHSGNFFSSKWRWSLPLHRWASRRATLTLVHMPSLLPVVAGWGAAAMEIGYVFEEQAPGQPQAYPLPAGTHIAVPSSFNPDEPVDLILAAARLAPDVTFHLTGNPERLPAELRQRLPANVRLTGYLTVDAYLALLRNATAVLALTTQDQTFQTGGAEAVWLTRPLIISDWPELRQVFARGAVFVAHTPQALAEAVRAVEARQAELEGEMRALKLDFDRNLRTKIRRLLALLAGGGAAGSRTTLNDWAAGEES
jgi:glycosyltransferase involved in cell wall biosynthesis